MGYKKMLYLLVLPLLFLWGCGPKGVTPVSVEDNPAHHYLQGMELIEKGKLQEAKGHLERAIALDPSYARAYAGKALVFSLQAAKQKDLAYKKVDIQKALNLLKKALDKAQDPTEKFSVYITAIRVYTFSSIKGWLDKAEDCYEKALSINKVDTKELIYYRNRSALYYFMGYAYYKAYKFRKAEAVLAKVLSCPPGKWHTKAEGLYQKVQKIVRAMAHYTITDVAKKIAIKEQVGRADVAALLVDELHLDRLMAGRIPLPSQEAQADFVPADILHNMFKDEILIVMKWHIRGLEPQYDPTTRAYLFHPDKPLKRKELALILEDLLIKITGDKSLATKYFGQDRSPFPDVPPTVAWYNAVMNAVSRGLMETDLSGAFRPDDYVDGAELLLAILRLRDVMNIY